jgi:hypothetical protein
MALKKGTKVELENSVGVGSFDAAHAEAILLLQLEKQKKNWWLPVNSKYTFENGELRASTDIRAIRKAKK